jgi:uncharacterized heparinase superfamily protein
MLGTDGLVTGQLHHKAHRNNDCGRPAISFGPRNPVGNSGEDAKTLFAPPVSRRSKTGWSVQILRHQIGNPARLFRTVRHLRAGQLVNRITRKFSSPGAVGRPTPATRPPKSVWKSCPGRLASMLSPTRFRFLGQEAELGTAGDWNGPSRTKLWVYNLHYFDDLRAEGAADRLQWHRDLVGRWLAENPPTTGNGWEPYPTSLRIVNWIASALAGNDLGSAALESLAIQARVLSATLEFHLLGNHLLANAKALIFAGSFFSGPEAEGWLQTGLDLLDAELDEQILDDGGHFELSPMYHAIILEDLLDLVQLCQLFPMQLEAKGRAWRMLAPKMLAWLAEMSHPDGEIGFFNDAAFGIARTHAELMAYAASFGIVETRHAEALRRLDASGYVRLQSGPFWVIFDAAEIGPSYLPGHGHADVLSVEVSLDGQRLVVNSGTSTYENDAERIEERSTAAHATVEIDGHSSSEVWASFRVGRRAHPFDLSTKNVVLSAAASHDGYRWLPGRPIHRRDIAVSPEALTVTDSISGTGEHCVRGRFPLHPSVRSVSQRPTGWRVELANGRMVRVQIDGASELLTEKGHFSPTFGQRISRPVLAWRHDGRLPLNIETRFEI